MGVFKKIFGVIKRTSNKLVVNKNIITKKYLGKKHYQKDLNLTVFFLFFLFLYVTSVINFVCYISNKLGENKIIITKKILGQKTLPKRTIKQHWGAFS